MTEAVAYLRCSGDSQIFGDTWERQIETITSCCRSHPFALLREYRDEGVAGKLDEDSRPAFSEMVSDLLKNGCRTVVVESLDRLARDYAIQQRLAEYLASKEIALIAANTGQDITAALMGDPMKRALVQMQGVFAELERRMLVDKLEKARGRIKEKGRRPGAKNYSEDPARNHHAEGRHRFGWKPGEEVVLERIFLLSRATNPSTGRRFSTREIAVLLNSAGLPTRGVLKRDAEGVLALDRKPWNAGTVAKILARPAKDGPCQNSCA